MICDEYVSGGSCRVSMHELLDSREPMIGPEGDSWRLQYILQGSNKECDIIQRIEHPTAGIPRSFQGISLQSYTFRNIGWNSWLCEVNYGFNPMAASRISALQIANAPSQYDMSTIGGTEHLTSSIKDVAKSDGAPDVFNAINWDGERVNGIDNTASKHRWTETWKMTKAEVFKAPGGYYAIPNEVHESDWFDMRDKNLIDRWEMMTGAVHGYDAEIDPGAESEASKRFRGYQWGEIKFEGAVMRQMDDHNVRVTFQFEIRRHGWHMLPDQFPNQPLNVDDPPTNGNIRQSVKDSSRQEVYKEGWDLITFLFKNGTTDPGDGGGEMVTRQPYSFIIQQVIRRVDFGYLGVPRLTVPYTNPQRCYYGNEEEQAGFAWDAAKC